ncbi:hypothetical protein ACI65C_011373, partial [Semiaphis heraclei]
MSRWKDVDIDEMKKFLGVLMFSGVVFDRQNGKMQRKRCHGCYSNLREDGQLSAEEAGKKAKK